VAPQARQTSANAPRALRRENSYHEGRQPEAPYPVSGFASSSSGAACGVAAVDVLPCLPLQEGVSPSVAGDSICGSGLSMASSSSTVPGLVSDCQDSSCPLQVPRSSGMPPAQGSRLGRCLRRVPSYCEGRDTPLQDGPILLSGRSLSTGADLAAPSVATRPAVVIAEEAPLPPSGGVSVGDPPGLPSRDGATLAVSGLSIRSSAPSTASSPSSRVLGALPAAPASAFIAQRARAGYPAHRLRVGRERGLLRVPSYCEGRDSPVHGAPLPESSYSLSARPASGGPHCSLISGLSGALPVAVSSHSVDDSVVTSAGQPSAPGPTGRPVPGPPRPSSAHGSPAPPPSAAVPTEATLCRCFTPEIVDASRCLARLVRDGLAKQCSSRPVKGFSVCNSHKPRKGKRNAAGHTSKYGLVSGPLPDEVLPELTSIWRASRSPEAAQSSG